jgi:Flp pilus assembly protein TadG
LGRKLAGTLQGVLQGRLRRLQWYQRTGRDARTIGQSIENAEATLRVLASIHHRFRQLRRPSRGQSLVEFALILPLVIFLFLAIIDLARVYATAVTVEAAAREAADYGSLYPWHWDEEQPAVIALTESEMERRACTAASRLLDYSEPDGTVDHETCTNPDFSYELLRPAGVTNCSKVERDATPCRVSVRLAYTFEIIVPVRIQFLNTRLGLPSEISIDRTSVFAVSDFELDAEETE